jgi:chromosome segregation ATPase
MDDEDLSGFDLAAAKEYILAFAVDAKRLDREIAAAQGELELWKGRKALAEGRLASGDQSMAALVQAADVKVEELSGKAAALAAEREELRAKVERMRRKLPMIQARERSIDPDRLLAELQLMTGELLGEGGGPDSAAAAEFAKLESEAKADSDLAALKRRASEGGAP